MDGVRIFNHYFTDDEIFQISYQSIDKANAPSAADTKISYNLDGMLKDNAESGGPDLYFRNNAKFSNPGSDAYKPFSPLVRDEMNSFPKGFYQGEDNSRIPLISDSSGFLLIY